MKNISKDTIDSASTETLQQWLDKINEDIDKGKIEWVNSKGETRSCPWDVFTGSGAVKVTRDADEILWDLGCAVQIRCEAERRNTGNMIAAMKCTKQTPKDRPATLTATVRTKNMPVRKCPVIAQLAEAQTFLSNASKLQSVINLRTGEERFAKLQEAESAHVNSIGDEQKGVAEELKARAKVKAEQAVKDAFKNKQPEPEGNGQPLVPVGA